LEREFHQILVARLERKIVELHGSSGYAAVIESLIAGDADPYVAADQLLAGIMTPDPPEDEDKDT
jgi:LAO/AO transport system kinase